MAKEMTIDEANDRDLAKLRERAPGGSETPEAQDDDDFEVSVEDDRPKPEEEPDEREDDEEGEEPETLPERPRAPRRERRSARYDEIERENQELRTRVTVAEQMARQQIPQQATPQATPQAQVEESQGRLRQRLEFIQGERVALQSMIDASVQNKTWNKDVEADVRRRALDLDILQEEAHEEHRTNVRRINQPAPQQQDPRLMKLRLDYADVDTSEYGITQMRAYFARDQRLNPKRDQYERLEEAMQYARAEMRGETFTPPSRQPRGGKTSAGAKARLTGTGSGAGGGGPATSQRRTLTREQARLAQLTYPSLEPGEAHKRYYKQVVMKGRS